MDRIDCGELVGLRTVIGSLALPVIIARLLALFPRTPILLLIGRFSMLALALLSQLVSGTLPSLSHSLARRT
ncbi:MAG: hypothetical protein E7L06_06580 [Schaalia turicensis]|nr:hypothetical protein [Schaalia turicensis]